MTPGTLCVVLVGTPTDEDMSEMYALVTLTPDEQAQILARHTRYATMKTEAPALYAHTYWGMPGDFFADLDVAKVLTEEQCDELALRGYFVLPPAMSGETSLYQTFFDALESVRTECDMLYVVDDQVYWKSAIKHTGVYIETAVLPLDLFAPTPKPAPKARRKRS